MRTPKILSLLLALVMIVGALASCAKSPAVMEYEGHTVSADMYAYWMSRYKGLFLYSYAGGNDSASFWSTEIADGITAETLFTNIIDENVKKNLVCMYLFDKYGLTLPSATEKSVDESIAQLIEDMGGKKDFNEYAADFGVDDKSLKEIYLIEEKIEYLRNYLYGKNGVEKLTDVQKTEYYEENYARVRHIFFSTSTQYVLDDKGNYTYGEDGNPITKTPTAEEINKQKVLANAIHARIEQGESFETLLEEYSEDHASSTYKNGYYLTATIDYIDEIVEAAFDMKAGEVRLVTSDYGIHIVKKYELDEKAYENEENKDFFEGFEDTVISEVFQNKLAEHLDGVSVNTEEKAKFSIVTSAANLQF